MFCTQCGARIKAGLKFCINCGAKLEESAAAKPAVSAQRTCRRHAKCGIDKRVCALPRNVHSGTIVARSASTFSGISPIFLWSGMILLLVAIVVTGFLIYRPSRGAALSDATSMKKPFSQNSPPKSEPQQMHLGSAL